MFVGIYYNLLKKIKYHPEINLLKELFEIVQILDHLGLDLPIIDSGSKTSLDKKVIRKIKF